MSGFFLKYCKLIDGGVTTILTTAAATSVVLSRSDALSIQNNTTTRVATVKKFLLLGSVFVLGFYEKIKMFKTIKPS